MATPNIDPKRTALILCDFQNGLVMSERPIEPWGAKTLIANAKKEVVEAERGRLQELLTQRNSLKAHLAELDS